MNQLNTDYSLIKNAKNIEEILCLATLIASGKLDHTANIHDANRYYEKIGDCNFCPFNEKCLACIINQ